jgi:hypothetical protein
MAMQILIFVATTSEMHGTGYGMLAMLETNIYGLNMQHANFFLYMTA